MAGEDRTRYVAFRVRGAEPTFGDVVRELRRREGEAWLVEFDGSHGVVRCGHTRRDEVVRLLGGLERVGDRDVRVETLGTSGTLKACRRKFLP